ncbi:nicotinate phosphoribosyltransferase [Steroidobacter sp. S1-65]|uniref:Nicotinate phosphoribosyltransferase n=1 Tax=Steroidobacter gossypii TaxID=2805490 RepID=A0ABS1WYE5_9GAMM|nr:nicotinate phosphoribosyltransferase [Steroidobacter gossypii]MBM0105996.1 nicotinate phosphoribosyltransferase [Steroidobacter gossypii]
MFTPIIHSLLDTDLYKLTMLSPILHRFPANQAVYSFVCRNTPQYALASLQADVEAQLDHLCTLNYTEEELEYLATKSYFKSDFIDFLRIFHFQRRYITVSTEGDTLKIVARGPQIHVMGFEIFVLSIVNELYFRRFNSPETIEEGRKRLAEKIRILREFRSQPPVARVSPPNLLQFANGTSAPIEAAGVRAVKHPFQFFDFGTRRRFSREWHEEMVTTFAREVPQYFKGTSNVHLARKYGLTAMGTMAHEYLQTFQAVGVQLRNFQKEALEAWVQEYRGDLGVALTDVVGMDAFISDFDLYFAKLFDGLRHDSGDPVVWGEKALAHYQRLRIDPHTKRLVFSDGLNIPKALALYEYFADRVQCGFGIGTDLSNDMGVPALNIVMKLTECNGQPVAKLSDTPGKTLCSDETFLAYLRQVFKRAA